MISLIKKWIMRPRQKLEIPISSTEVDVISGIQNTTRGKPREKGMVFSTKYGPLSMDQVAAFIKLNGGKLNDIFD